jgi:cation diffusion facilitator family transporter
MRPLLSRLAFPSAVAANGMVALAKLIVARRTGSSAVLSEAVHSAVATAEGLIVLLGLHLGHRPRDASHPFGYRRALYHLSLVAGVVLFAGGAAFSIYRGLLRLHETGILAEWRLALLVIGGAALLEATSYFVARRRMRRPRDELAAARGTGSPNVDEEQSALVALGDGGEALLGLMLAALGIVLTRLAGSPFYDGWASIAIGGVLLVAAALRVREVREVPVGARSREDVVRSIRQSAEGTPGLTAVNRVLTMQLGPRRILVALDVALEQGLTEPDLGRVLRRLEDTIRRAHPVVRHIYVDVHPASGTGTGH